MADDERHLHGLQDLLASIDGQVRVAAVRAHCAAVEACARLHEVTIGDVCIPPEALVPRDLLESSKVAMELEITMHDDGRVTLSKGHRLMCGATRAKLAIEWESVQAPEATALVRTKAETKVT